jgi:hypothetical protein
MAAGAVSSDGPIAPVYLYQAAVASQAIIAELRSAVAASPLPLAAATHGHVTRIHRVTVRRTGASPGASGDGDGAGIAISAIIAELGSAVAAGALAVASALGQGSCRQPQQCESKKNHR